MPTNNQRWTAGSPAICQFGSQAAHFITFVGSQVAVSVPPFPTQGSCKAMTIRLELVFSRPLATWPGQLPGHDRPNRQSARHSSGSATGLLFLGHYCLPSTGSPTRTSLSTLKIADGRRVDGHGRI